MIICVHNHKTLCLQHNSMPKLDEGHAQSINDRLEQDDDRDYPVKSCFYSRNNELIKNIYLKSKLCDIFFLNMQERYLGLSPIIRNFNVNIRLL